MIFRLLFRPICLTFADPGGVSDLLRHGNGKSEQGVNVSGRICERISQDCTDMEDSRCLAWAHPPTIPGNRRCLAWATPAASQSLLEPPRASESHTRTFATLETFVSFRKETSFFRVRS